MKPATLIRIRYQPPDCMANDLDMRRLLHEDLPTMTDAELFAERHAAEDALVAEVQHGCRVWLTHPDHIHGRAYSEWLQERLAKVSAEIVGRLHAAGSGGR